MVCPDDGNPCTRETCITGQCQHQPILCDDRDICTFDQCNPRTGECTFSPIGSCGVDSADCRSLGDCSSCSSQAGCSWLSCTRSDSFLSNVTVYSLNNSSRAFNLSSSDLDYEETTSFSAITSEQEVPFLEDLFEVHFRLGERWVFLVDGQDFLELGRAQSVFAECLSEDSTDQVTARYESGGEDIICAVLDNSCEVQSFDLLASQVGTIGTSVGVAGGAGVGCFCGSCIVAVLFFRRKKKKDEIQDAALSIQKSFAWNEENQFSNDLFVETSDQNPLFEPSAAF